MPIRADLRAFYGREWQTVTRPRILKRAGGRFDAKGKYLGGARCEQCHVPDRQKIPRGPAGSWHDGMTWRNSSGFGISPFESRFVPNWNRRREVRIVLTVAHLNHTPGDDRDENLKALCQWCHLNYDKLHHAETRATRKDRARPLLREAS